MNTIWKLVFILSVAGSVAAQHKAQATSFADAQAAAEANMLTPEGLAYDDQLGTHFMQKHVKDMQLCMNKVKNRERGFWILLRIDKNGSAKEIVARPSSKLSKCMRAAMLNDKFPTPPSPEYWATLQIGLGFRPPSTQ